MTNWLPQITRNGTPLYIEIADVIENDIESGRLPAGTRLPPVRNVAFDIGVTNGTVSRAYKLACERGLVSGEVGRGTYVLEKSVQNLPVANSGPSEPGIFALPGHFDQSNQKYQYQFGYSSAVDVGQSQIIAEAAGRIANGHPSKIMDYVRHVPDEWREAGARWLATPGWQPDPADVIATNGAHAAIIAIILGSIFLAISPPLLKVLPLSAFENSLPTDCGTPAFLANAGLLATAAMKLCCFLLVLGIRPSLE